MPNYVAVGAEFMINSATTYTQQFPDLAKLKGGRFVAVWESNDFEQDPDGFGIKGRVMGADGVPVGPDFLINTATYDWQKLPSVAGLADGGFVVTWTTDDDLQDGSDSAIKAQRFDANGAKVGTEFLVNTHTAQLQWISTAAGLDNGGFVITWETYDTTQDRNGYAMKAQIFDAAGAKVGSEFVVNTTTTGNQVNGEISALSGGRFIVIWGDTINSGDVRAQVFDSTGAKLGAEIFVNSQTVGSQVERAVTNLANGGFVITWRTYDTAQDGSGHAIKAQVFDASGAKVGGEFLVNTATAQTQSAPTVAGLDNGDFVIAWRTDDQTAGDGGGGAIKAQVFSSTGAKVGAEFLVNSTPSMTESSPSVVDLGNGSFVIGWSATGWSTYNSNIYGQIFSAAPAPTIVSNGGGETASVSVGENQDWVTTVAATDPDGPAGLSYSIVGGSDSSRFFIDSQTGAVRFHSAPDFEAPSDSNGDNVYQLVVRASDGLYFDDQTINVTVANVNEAVTITSDGGGLSADLHVGEGTKTVTTVAASDEDAFSQLSYSIAGGVDSHLFTIDAASGVLSFINPPDHENASDSGADGIYSVIVRASDGTNSDEQQIFVHVSDLDEGITFSASSLALHVEENLIEAGTFQAVSETGDPIVFSITGGADSALFAIDSATGELSFLAAPNFEAPGDSDGDNVYDLEVTAQDGTSSATRSAQVTVLNYDEDIRLASYGGAKNVALTLAENGLSAAQVDAGDPDGDTIHYHISGGRDSHLFAVGLLTGTLTFVGAPNFEAPADYGGDNVYDVHVSASSESSYVIQHFAIGISNVNEGLAITSNGGGATASFSLVENESHATTVTAHDPEGAVPVYSITGGTDASRFTINATTGWLRFVGLPDFEARGDSDRDNIYNVIVSATDGEVTDSQALTITVTNVNEGPAYTGSGEKNYNIIENRTAVATFTATDPEGGSVTWSITRGADAALFAIDPVSGALRFITAPNFEAPADAGANNVYNLTITASDGTASTDRNLTVEILNSNEGPVIVSGGGGATASYSVAENATAVTFVTSTDPDGTPATYSITGGADASRFAIDSATGALRFVAAPNFETRGDSNYDNIYNVIVSATDGELSDSQALAITVTNVDEAPVIEDFGTFHFHIENGTEYRTTFYASDPEFKAVTWSIVGGADAALFTISPSPGVLRFLTAPNFEAPTDADGNNYYEVTIAASDGIVSTTRTLNIQMIDRDEGPVIVSAGGGDNGSITLAENKNLVMTVVADDPDARDSANTFSIVGGADAALFYIIADTGRLFFKTGTGANFEAPTDAGGNNVYDVIVAVSDGRDTPDTQALAITVTNVNDPPVITSNGGSFFKAFLLPENQLTATIVTATDVENAPLTYAIVSGPDAALFTIDAQTGVLSFKAAPDREAPRDANADNTYDVTVSVTDGETIDTQQLWVMIADANEAPAITSNGGGSAAALTVDENEFAVTTVSATDPEGKALSFAITGGADAERFTINAATGALSFVAPEDYERPRDSDQNNVYDVIVSASDGSLSDTQALSIAIGNLNFVDIVSNGGGYWADIVVDENQTAVTIVQADQDDASPLTYSISGDNADRFTIDAQTGELRFTVAPDFEMPSGWRNTGFYFVTVTASDGTISDSQDLNVSVNNVIELELVAEGHEGQHGELLVPENGIAVTTLEVIGGEGPFTYEIVGGDDALWFVLDPETGVLSFGWEQDYEKGKYAPQEPAPWANDDYLHLYEVIVRASNGELVLEKTLLVRVEDVNEAPEFYYHDGADQVAVSVAENMIGTISVAAHDPDRYSWVSYWLEGADAGLFEIDTYDGGLRFIQALDREAPIDADRDNVYEVSVVAFSGGLNATQSFSITIEDEFEPVSISSNGGGDLATLTVPENGSAVTVLTAVGDGPVHYEILGGADADWFTLDPNSGELTFAYLPNYEDTRTKSHGGHAPTYYVTVRANNDGSYDDQSLTIHVQDVDEAPSFVSYGGAADVALTVNENAQAVAIARAYDPDSPATVTYALAGGADSALFEVDPTSGALRLKQRADFEAPADSDGDNVYEVTVSANPGAASATQAFSITIADVDENVAITSNGGGASATVSVAENGTAVTSVAAASGLSVTYSIVGGADRSFFSINASTGALAFTSAPDFEKIADFDGDNVFEVIVRAGNGVASDDQHLSVNLTNVDEIPYFFDAKPSVDLRVTENGEFVGNMAATDPDGGPAITYAITGGADAQSFVVDPNTGALSFRADRRPDFEAPSDSGGDNVYELLIAASQGSWSSAKLFTVTVENANEQPRITSDGGGTSAAIELDEGQRAVTTVTGADDGPNPVTYSITGGPHAGLFAIDPVTGALSFVAAPDHEAPLGGSNNFYSVTVTASDGELSDSQSIQVAIRDINEGVTITSDAATSVVENGFWVTTVAARDLDGDPVSFALSGGVDSALFAIDSQSGELRFLASPNFEAPADSDGDNVYEIEVSASDGSLSGSKSIAVTVTNRDEGLAFVSGGGGDEAAVTVNENDAVVMSLLAVDPEGGPAVRYSIMGGADASSFYLDEATQTLRFHSMPVYHVRPDFETPRDSDGDNVYEVIVGANDEETYDFQTILVTVANVYEGLGFGSVDFYVQEGTEEIGSVSADSEAGLSVVYSITGGEDASLFSIDAATGAIRWIDSPDFEQPRDSNGDNYYYLEVTADDGISTNSQYMYVTVGNVYEGVSFGSPAEQMGVAEGYLAITRYMASSGDGASIVYFIAGGVDSSLFDVDPLTGEIVWLAAPDYETPRDSDGDNRYELILGASDGTSEAELALTFVVANRDEPIEILSYGGAASVALTMTEGTGLTVATVEADDEEDWIVTYAIAGGADAALFRIDASTGVLAFNYGVYPDFEAPADAGGDNVYDVTVTASSSTSSADQAFALTIADRNEGLRITSNGGGDADLTMNEGGRSVTVVTAEDQDGDVPIYSIVGGADSALFAIDAATGALTFVAAPDYEAPNSASGTNSYLVEVGAGDGEFTATQRIRIQIGNVNERPAITTGGGGESAAVTVNENGLAVTGVAATDPDGNTLTYSISGGADASRFAIDSSSGALSFVQRPNFEAPGDVGGDNVYDVVVSVTDGLLTDSQAIAVTVANLAEIVTITSNGGGSSASVAVAENGTAVATVSASSSDGGGAVTYAIAGGADASRFTIDAVTGILAFLAAPNFEAPADAGANNVYDVVVSAANGATTDTQALAVTVGNVNEPVAITSNGGGAAAAASVTENGNAVTVVAGVDLDGGPLTYAIVGGADSDRFTINVATGVLVFRAAPDFEAPADSDGNNVYDVVVRASDGSFTDTQTIAVTVGNVNEAPVITSNGGGANGNLSVVENSLVVTVVAATDAEGAAATFSIVGGADAARFTIDAQTGALRFVVAPDWEMPGNSSQNNVYAVVVRASDGLLVDDQALSVTVTNARDGNNVTGTSGSDTISATSTNVSLRTSNEEDLVFGRDGHDSIYGMAGADELYGEGGNDLLVGGEGADKLLGGLGKDQFTYNALSESTAAVRDLIMDFSRAQGDKISLSAIDSNSALFGNQAFTFIGTAAFSNTAGQLRYETAGGMTTIFGDVNGDGVADLQIQLSGSIALIGSDFIL